MKTDETPEKMVDVHYSYCTRDFFLSMKNLILLTISSLIVFWGPISNADSEEPTNYCKDEAGWKGWHDLLEKYPDDDSIHALYALRLGLCSMVDSGNMPLSRATDIFEKMKESVIDHRREESELEGKKQKHGT